MTRCNRKKAFGWVGRRSRTSCVLLVLLALVLAICTTAHGQPEKTVSQDQSVGESEKSNSVTIDELTARIEALAARTDLTPEQNALLKSLYEETIANLKRLDDARAKADQFETDRLAAPKLLDQVNTHLRELGQTRNAIPPETAPTRPDGRSAASLELPELRQQLADAQAALLSTQSVKKDLETVQSARDARRKMLPDLLLAKGSEVLKARDDSKGFTPRAEESGEIAQARRLRRSSLADALAAELDALKREQLMIDQRSELLMRRIDEATLLANLTEKKLAMWQQFVDDRQINEAAQREIEARKAARLAALLHPIAKSEADRNQQLTAQGTVLASEKESITKRKREISDSRSKLTADFQPVETRIELERQMPEGGGQTDTPGSSFGLVMRKLRSKLPDLHALKRDLSQIERRMSAIQADAMEFSSERRAILDQDDREKIVNDLMVANQGEIPQQDIGIVRETLLDIYRERVALLGVLGDDFDRQFSALSDLANELSQYILQCEKYETYINQHILWVRSTQIINLSDIENIPGATAWLFSTNNWQNAAVFIIHDARGQPVLYILIGIILFVLLLGARLFRRRLKGLGAQIGWARTDRFGSTILAALITLILPLLIPLGIGFIGLRFVSVGESAFDRAIGSGFMNAARLIYITLVILAVGREDGLAVIHFRARARTWSLVRCHLRWFVVVAPVCAFVVEALDSQTDQSWADSLGRVSFVVAMAASAIILYRFLRPSTGVFEGLLKRQPNGWGSKLRYLWSSIMVLLPCMLAIMALAGYFYTAIQIERKCVNTVLFVLVLWFLESLAVRWILMTQKRIAIEKSDARKSADQAQSNPNSSSGEMARAGIDISSTLPPIASAGTPGATPKHESKFETPLAEIGLQAKRLLRSLAVLTFLFGAYLIWREVLPALGALDRVVLFGAQTEHPVALSHVLGAVVIVLATIAASRNLPGLLEIAVMSRLPLQASARYAIRSLFQYVISIGGILAAFGAVGVTWSDVQWLLAAATVGLGFGLQEIFANFVSGLIILFEQPIRVGDTITIGETNGTVSKIRMRATTITDWDRKELIVPNREFITNSLINWTLSDPILRVKIPVGIAYGSDTRKATDLLRQVAKSDPTVLDEPEPSVVFDGFGDSTLNFSLRVYIPDIEHFIPIKHYLNTAIDDAFRKAGIEMAFPQRDIHIRSIDDILPLRNESKRKVQHKDEAGLDKTRKPE